MHTLKFATLCARINSESTEKLGAASDYFETLECDIKESMCEYSRIMCLEIQNVAALRVDNCHRQMHSTHFRVL